MSLNLEETRVRFISSRFRRSVYDVIYIYSIRRLRHSRGIFYFLTRLTSPDLT